MKHPDSLILALCMLALDATPAAMVATFAGTGAKGFSGDGGPATQAALNEPYEMDWEKDGSVFLGGNENHRVHVWRN